MRKFLKEQLRTMLVGASSALLVFLLWPALQETRSAVCKVILATLSPRALLGLSGGLGVVAILSFAYSISVRHSFSKEYLRRKYPVDSSNGLRYSRKDGAWICPRCFDKGEINSIEIEECNNQTHNYVECHVDGCLFSKNFKAKTVRTNNVV